MEEWMNDFLFTRADANIMIMILVVVGHASL